MPNDVLYPSNLKITANHEAGHAIVGVITFFTPIFPAKQEEHQTFLAALPEKKCFFMNVCIILKAESKGLFRKTRGRS